MKIVNLIVSLKRKFKDLYWFLKDQRLTKKISDNPETYFIYAPRDTDKISIDVYIRSGIAIEEDRVFGVGHLLEHYISEKHGQKFNSDIRTNGRINHEVIHLYGKIDKGKPLRFIEQFLDEIFVIYFDDQEILAYEKLAIQNELNTDSHSLLRRVERTVENERFADRCGSMRSFEDSIESTKNLALTDIKEHYQKIVNRQNVKIFISAYSPSNALIDYVKKLVTKYQLPDGNKTEYPDCRYSDRKVLRIPDSSIAGTYVYLTFPAPVSISSAKKRITARILFDLITGREEEFSVNRQARKEGIYSINYYWIRMEKLGILALHSYVPANKVKNLVQIIVGSFKTAKTRRAPDIYLNSEIEDLIDAYRRDWRSNARVNWMMEEILDFESFKSFSAYEQILNTITPQDVQDLARELFVMEKLNLVMYGELPDEEREKIDNLLDF